MARGTHRAAVGFHTYTASGSGRVQPKPPYRWFWCTHKCCNSFCIDRAIHIVRRYTARWPGYNIGLHDLVW